MKYLNIYKEFENLKIEDLKVGDYVLMNYKKIYDYYKKRNYIHDIQKLKYNLTEEPFAQIINITISDDFPYQVEFYNNHKFYTSIMEIKRLLNPDEIKEYEIKKSINKYNL